MSRIFSLSQISWCIFHCVFWPEQFIEEASRHFGSDDYFCKELAQDGSDRKGWSVCEVAACEYTHVKEDPDQNEHSKPWMERNFQASCPGSQVTIPSASCLWLGQGKPDFCTCIITRKSLACLLWLKSPSPVRCLQLQLLHVQEKGLSLDPSAIWVACHKCRLLKIA